MAHQSTQPVQQNRRPCTCDGENPSRTKNNHGEKTMTTPVQFLITTESDKVDQLADLLKQNGFDLDPVDHMISMPSDNVLEGIFMGGDVSKFIGPFNEHLDKNEINYAVREDFPEWTPETRMGFLYFLTFHCTWNDDYQLVSTSEDEFTKFRKSHPQAVKSA